MRKQVTHVSIHQSSKVIAAMYGFIVFLVSIPVALYTAFHGDWGSALMLLIFTPLFYLIVFYIGHVIGFFIYNFIAKHLGGIEFDLKDLALQSIRSETEESVVSERTINEGNPLNPDQMNRL